jgi:tetratricopeptide (TPR) repeat protein
VVRIEKLLSAAVPAPASDAIKLRAAERALASRAPFHRQCNGMGDSVVIETYAECLDALPRLERGLALCTTDLASWYLMTIAGLGYAYAMTGRLADALPRLEQAVERARHVDQRRETQWLVYLSETYLRAGRQDDAYAVAEQALALGREWGERGTEAGVLRLLGEIAARCEPPTPEEAEAYYRAALALAEELGTRPLVGHCHLGLGMLYRKIDKREQARAELSTAIELCRSMEMTFWLPQAEAALAQV